MTGAVPCHEPEANEARSQPTPHRSNQSDNAAPCGYAALGWSASTWRLQIGLNNLPGITSTPATQPLSKRPLRYVRFWRLCRHHPGAPAPPSGGTLILCHFPTKADDKDNYRSAKLWIARGEPCRIGGKALLRSRHGDDFNQIVPRKIGADASPLRPVFAFKTVAEGSVHGQQSYYHQFWHANPE